MIERFDIAGYTRISVDDELYRDNVGRGELMQILRDVGDIQRLTSRAVYGTANGRVRRYYAITPAGQAALEDQVKQWKAYAAGVRRVLRKGGAFSGA